MSLFRRDGVLFVVCFCFYDGFLLKTAQNAVCFFCFFFGRNGVCLFGLMLSLGFSSNCIIFQETSVFPNSVVIFLPRNHCTVYAFCAPLSLLQQSLSMLTIVFFSDVPSWIFLSCIK